MSDCLFCAGAYISPIGVGSVDGISPMPVYLMALGGKPPERYGVRLEDGCMMIDNSCGEYREARIPIEYCPFCGRKVSGDALPD